MAVFELNGGSGGGSEPIPFNLSPYSSRCTITNSNCYLYRDNGVTKMHFECTITTNTSISSGSTWAYTGMVFNATNIAQSNVLGNDFYFKPESDGATVSIRCSTSRSSGYSVTFNEDINCTFEFS